MTEHDRIMLQRLSCVFPKHLSDEDLVEYKESVKAALLDVNNEIYQRSSWKGKLIMILANDF